MATNNSINSNKPIGVVSGGTGVASTTAYVPICGGTTSTAALQAASTGFSTSGSVLTSTGASSLPTWQVPAATSISVTGDSGGALTGAAFTFTGGSTGLTFSGAVSTETLTGTLVVSNGGTGVATMTTAYAPVCAGTTPTGALQVASTGLATSGFILTSTGASSLPTFQAPAASSISITGNTGGALTGASFTFTGGSTGLSFGGAGSTQTLTFAGITANGGTVNLATDATTSSINLGTGAGAKTTILGSTNSTSTTTLQAGSGGVKLGSVAEGALVTSSTSVISTVTGTSGYVLTANGAGVAPSFQILPAVSPLSITTVAFGASPYTVLSGDQFISVTSSGGAISIVLPNSPATGRVIYIKDGTGNAATNNITVSVTGGVVTIDGSTTFVMNSAYESISVIFNGSNYLVF